MPLRHMSTAVFFLQEEGKGKRKHRWGREGTENIVKKKKKKRKKAIFRIKSLPACKGGKRKKQKEQDRKVL